MYSYAGAVTLMMDTRREEKKDRHRTDQFEDTALAF
jgi:hypothetical protein